MAAPSTTPAHLKQEIRRGFVVFTDIKDFSLYDDKKQVRLVQSMWELLRNQPLMRRELDRTVNVTGDGAVIALNEVETKPSAEDVFTMAREWEKASIQAGIPMRVALHYGVYFLTKVDGFPNQVALGGAVNDCARILGFAEPGFMVLSEAFRQHWQATDQDNALRKHAAKISRFPITIWVKHNRPLSINLHVASARKTIPRRFREINFLGEKIRRMLMDILHSFETLLADYDSAYTPQQIGARITILAPYRKDEKHTVLRSSLFREKTAGRDSVPGEQSRVIYPLNRSGTGPPGLAYTTQDVRVLHRLPDYSKSPDRYLRKFAEADVPSKMVKDFSCHSRAFIDIPFGLDPGNSDGVICIDTLDPLQPFKAADLVKFGKTIREIYGYNLALHWRMRIQ
jgi:class 3 adenylate cyclase